VWRLGLAATGRIGIARSVVEAIPVARARLEGWHEGAVVSRELSVERDAAIPQVDLDPVCLRRPDPKVHAPRWPDLRANRQSSPLVRVPHSVRQRQLPYQTSPTCRPAARVL